MKDSRVRCNQMSHAQTVISVVLVSENFVSEHNFGGEFLEQEPASLP